jgi:hypothetical protein
VTQVMEAARHFGTFFAASQASFQSPTGFVGSVEYAHALNSSPAPYSSAGEDVVMGLAVRKLARQHPESPEDSIVERNKSPFAGFSLGLTDFKDAT